MTTTTTKALKIAADALAGGSLRRLATLTGYSPTMLSMVARGERPVSERMRVTLLALAKAHAGEIADLIALLEK